jgi:hypothetical protein
MVRYRSPLGLPMFLAIACFSSMATLVACGDEPKRMVLIAGKPSHPPRMHEFNAGVQLLAKCLKDFDERSSEVSLDVQFVLNGWPRDEQVLKNADAVVFYMDGGGGHEVVQESGRRMKLVEELASNGVGIGCMHFAVEVVADQAGKEFKRWIGGHYEHMFSCNPIWEPSFSKLPEHPITRGVRPFQIKDEWYFNMRFIDQLSGNESAKTAAGQFFPILVASPSDDVRDGPYVYPAGPYPHIESNRGRAESMMWAIERPDGGRGFGFTGGHFHDNWGNEDFRKTVLNACLWLTKAEVPMSGVESQVSQSELNTNLDPKK